MQNNKEKIKEVDDFMYFKLKKMKDLYELFDLLMSEEDYDFSIAYPYKKVNENHIKYWSLNFEYDFNLEKIKVYDGFGYFCFNTPDEFLNSFRFNDDKSIEDVVDLLEYEN